MEQVPVYKSYYPTVRDMTPDQSAFYREFRNRWRERYPIPINGQVSYAFCLAYELIEQRDMRKAAVNLLAIAEDYKNEEKVSEYCRAWAADCYAVEGDFTKALDVFPPIMLSGRSSMQTDDLLTYKYHAKSPATGCDILTIFCPKVTAYAKNNLDLVAKYLNNQLAVIAEREGDILAGWVSDPLTIRGPASVFSGVPIERSTTKFLAFSFSLNPSIEIFCQTLTRNAENALREDNGLPRVGEGWVEETRLYYALRDVFSTTEVVQHARPPWLDLQHVDVFFPELMVAIEYQNVQHDRPVHYFGGEQAFRKSQERDARKRRLCADQNVRLVEVRAGYELSALVEEIRLYISARAG